MTIIIVIKYNECSLFTNSRTPNMIVVLFLKLIRKNETSIRYEIYSTFDDSMTNYESGS